MNCKNCGAVLSDNDSFCKQCGHPVQSNNTTTQSYSNPNPTPNYNNYSTNNTYQYQNNPKGNSNVGKIILTIVLAIVFWLIGFGICKLIFDVKSATNFDDNKSALIQEDNVSLKDNSTAKSPSTDNNISSNSNYIITDNGIKVSFKLPNTLRIDTAYSDSNRKCIEKINDDDSDFVAWIGEEYGTLSEYIEDVKEKATSRKSNNDYSDVQISDIKTMTVNNHTFTYMLLNYNMSSTQFKDAYIAYELEDDSLYTVELERYDLISSDELNDLLTITISK